MTDYTLASSADFADALIAARRARNTLFVILIIMLLFQIGLFIAARYRVVIDQPNVGTDALRYSVGVVDFLGVTLPAVLSVVLLLMTLISLMGRLLGVASLVRAFVASIILCVLLFPWQAFLMDPTFNSDPLRIPGVLYCWSELLLRVRGHPGNLAGQVLLWARFVAWPVVALALLVHIQLSSTRALRLAMRPAAVPVPPNIVTVPPANI